MEISERSLVEFLGACLNDVTAVAYCKTLANSDFVTKTRFKPFIPRFKLDTIVATRIQVYRSERKPFFVAKPEKPI